LAINQLLRLVLSLGQPVADTVLEFCGYTNRTVVSPLRLNPACRADHTRFEIVTAARPLAESPLAELARAGGLGEATDSVVFRVGDHTWVGRGVCACSADIAVRRFVREGTGPEACCSQCRAAVQPSPFDTHRDFPPAILGEALDRPLRQLAAGQAPYVIVRAGERAALICDTTACRSAAPIAPQPLLERV
jgi:hypothetical protein